jgi:beta-N-acetylhexosaminidase
MADTLTAARAAVPDRGPDRSQTDLLDDAALVGTFDVAPAAPAWLTRAAGRFTVVRLEDRPNMAIGVLPWGPDLSGHHEVVLHPGDGVDPAALGPSPVLVLGRDVHRHPSSRAAVDRLRGTHDVLVVDLGWPSPDRAYADVATFGASRRVGQALQAWLGEPPSPAREADG